jgi:hypothetical protein
VLEGDLAGADGPASLFIDRFGFAFRGGAVGVGRVGFARGGYGRVAYGGRYAVARGGAWYRGGAAVAGAAALGTAAAYGAAASACGYYPYPPCY